MVLQVTQPFLHHPYCVTSFTDDPYKLCHFVPGALIYRLFRGEKKKKLKVLHAATMFTAFVLTVFALKAAFDSHNEVLLR